MIQLQYRIPKGMKPTRAQVQEWGRAFIEGRKVPGVRIRAIDWKQGGTQDQIRSRLDREYKSRVAGLVDCYAGRNLTMCDYDKPNPRPMARVWAMARMLGIRPLFVEWSRTRRGWHLVIEWDREFSAEGTIVIQAILGSDAFRETYNLARVWSQQPDAGHRWNLLFREKIK